MLKIGLTNVTGRMGIAMIDATFKSEGIKISAGLSRQTSKKHDFPVFDDIEKLLKYADIIVDFSHPDVTKQLLKNFCKKPLVICTTNLSEETYQDIQRKSKEAPILQASNTSVGICVFQDILKKYKEALKEFDIDVFDRHHRNKIDAPSGTAKDIINVLSNSETSKIYNQSLEQNSRPENSIGFSYERSGNVFGEHKVSFTSNDESLSISHKAFNRGLFASGALKAAQFIANKKNGYYTMSDVLGIR